MHGWTHSKLLRYTISGFFSSLLEMEARRTELEIPRRSVPEGVVLERLIRYEAHLSRIEDRKLTQLERLQLMRRGQPVLPPVKVDVSSD